MTRKEKSTVIPPLKHTLFPNYRIEAEGNSSYSSVTVSGVHHVVNFTDEAVKINTRKDSIEFFGKNISLVIFEERTVEISGNIEGIYFKKRAKGMKLIDKT
jgi:hypothetical protein